MDYDLQKEQTHGNGYAFCSKYRPCAVVKAVAILHPRMHTLISSLVFRVELAGSTEVDELFHCSEGTPLSPSQILPSRHRRKRNSVALYFTSHLVRYTLPICAKDQTKFLICRRWRSQLSLRLRHRLEYAWCRQSKARASSLRYRCL